MLMVLTANKDFLFVTESLYRQTEIWQETLNFSHTIINTQFRISFNELNSLRKQKAQ